ncbi:hypothetical protein [Demequina aestuarii]|uniref:hypothetical protein n=1 Tax=Demequina aestuarii TaxID=327095 RepID=UPI001EE6BFDC|nr:hypothetical protein [Demequina aestuarii]
MTTPRFTTQPTNATTPAAGDATGAPTSAARSTPRWPAIHGSGGIRASATARMGSTGAR